MDVTDLHAGAVALDDAAIVIAGPPGSGKSTLIDVITGTLALDAGRITRDQLVELEASVMPGSGTCGAMFTANTMSTLALFVFGAFVSALVAIGLWMTVAEFKRSESGRVESDPRFPL